jgi:hypothetical protein
MKSQPKGPLEVTLALVVFAGALFAGAANGQTSANVTANPVVERQYQLDVRRVQVDEWKAKMEEERQRYEKDRDGHASFKETCFALGAGILTLAGLSIYAFSVWNAGKPKPSEALSKDASNTKVAMLELLAKHPEMREQILLDFEALFPRENWAAQVRAANPHFQRSSTQLARL